MKRSRFPLAAAVVESYRESLTPNGRYVLWATGAVAVLGLDTRENQVFKVFALGAAMLLVATCFGLARAPRFRLECFLPTRATAGRASKIHVRVGRARPGFLGKVLLSFPRPRRWGSSIDYRPRQVLHSAEADAERSYEVTLTASRRGRYLLRGLSARTTDPLGLVGGRARREPDQVLLAYPRFYSLDDFMVPVGRRYQPGGIPLASHTGDAVEFVGTRDYRPGDPVKNIHFRSWARRGAPVVKEFQEEYFSRLALILDTFVPRRARAKDVDAFEARISVLASIADFFSRGEHIVDILAAGPEVYEVSAGRSLAYFENVLDVLACLEPCHERAFESIGPVLLTKLAQITSVVAVLADWDAPRRDFLRRVREMGAELRVVIVREAPTTMPWEGDADELGRVEWMTPSDVDRLIAASGSPGRGFSS